MHITGEPGQIIDWRHDLPRQAGASSRRKSQFPLMAELCLQERHPCDGSYRPEGESMLAIQARLPLGTPFRPRARNVRRPFRPVATGPYKLPRDVQERLTAALAPFRNRESSYALAIFLARFWSAPGKIVEAFHIDRRALAEHGELGLTEKRIRSALRTLEEIGFLDRAVTSGSRYKATDDGPRRKPIRFQFGGEYAPLFIAANNRAAAARGRHSGERKPLAPSTAPSPSTVNFRAASLKGPKNKSEADKSVNLGPLVKSGLPPQASEPNSQLEAALDRLLQGIRQSRGG
jgi:hypothetical protein